MFLKISDTVSMYLDTVYTHQQVDHPFSGVRSNGGESRRRMSHADATVDHDGPWGLLKLTAGLTTPWPNCNFCGWGGVGWGGVGWGGDDDIL